MIGNPLISVSFFLPPDKNRLPTHDKIIDILVLKEKKTNDTREKCEVPCMLRQGRMIISASSVLCAQIVVVYMFQFFVKVLMSISFADSRNESALVKILKAFGFHPFQ